MDIRLGARSAETVRVYFEKAQLPEIRSVLPQKARTVEEALADYERSLLPGAASYGRTILYAGRYVGDIWCYCIDPGGDPEAMLSYCVFEKDLWNKGIASEAVRLFLADITDRYALRSVGAFTFADNKASVRVLEKNGFMLRESFTEDERLSGYYLFGKQN